jgi:superfamily II DNA or RNA helicase
MGFILRPYQEEAVSNIINAVESDVKGLLIMATGLGKTVIFAEAIKQLSSSNKKSLVLAHREELINQAIRKIHQQSGIYPDKEKAEDWASKSSRVVVGSVMTMQRERLHTWPFDNFDFITVDEAHHVVAPTYQNILNHFQEYALLGVTATPDRADERELGNTFDEIIYNYSLPQAIKDEWLAPIVGKRVRDFQIDLSDLKVVAGDFQDKDLGEVIEQYVAPLTHNIKLHTADRKTLIFCPDVASSELIAATLNASGIASGYISGRLDSSDRHKVLNQFNRGIISHLCSCNILLEGYDEPSVDAIVMLRPTSSRSLYAQAIGRGTRKHPGKENLLLLEFTFNTDKLKLVHPYELFTDRKFNENVRRRAQSLETEDYIDYMSNLETAEKKVHEISDILSRITVKEYNFETFDPVAIADLAGCDITCEYELKYQGRKLEGRVTDKQKDILMRYGIRDFSNMDKAQASVLISTFFDNNWKPFKGFASPAQLKFLHNHGYRYQYMTKALASVIISRIKEEKKEGTWRPPEEPIEQEAFDLNWIKEKSRRVL